MKTVSKSFIYLLTYLIYLLSYLLADNLLMH